MRALTKFGKPVRFEMTKVNPIPKKKVRSLMRTNLLIFITTTHAVSQSSNTQLSVKNARKYSASFRNQMSLLLHDLRKRVV